MARSRALATSRERPSSLLRRARSCALALAILSVSASCSVLERRSCELEAPVVVTRSDGLSFDGVAVDLHRERVPLFAWSDARGLAIKLAHDGTRVHIGERCRGGIDLVGQPDGAYLACSRAPLEAREPAHVGESESAPLDEVVLYAIDARLRARQLYRFGPVGRDGRGVALGVLSTPVRAGASNLGKHAIYLAYHDGSFGQHAIHLATIREGRVQQRRLSAHGAAAGEPALLVHAGHVYTAYSQLELEADGKPASSLWIARDSAEAVRIQKTRVYAAAPQLSADARGLLLAYRELPTKRSRSELMVARLDEHLRLSGEPRAIGRANGEGEPALRACGELVSALLPREYGNERFVGVNALDGELQSLGPGHQFYASEREFVLARATCVDARWLLFVADRAAPGKPGVEAVSLAFHCE